MKLPMFNGNEEEVSFFAAPYTTIIQKIGRCILSGDTSVPIFEIGTPGTDKKKNSGMIFGIKNPPSFCLGGRFYLLAYFFLSGVRRWAITSIVKPSPNTS